MLPFSLRSSLNQLQLTFIKRTYKHHLSVHDPIAVAFFIELPKSFSKKDILWSASLDLLTKQIRFRHVFRPKMAQNDKAKQRKKQWETVGMQNVLIPLQSHLWNQWVKFDFKDEIVTRLMSHMLYRWWMSNPVESRKWSQWKGKNIV